jgi:hypothetical protein
VIATLFFFTGLAIILYLNQDPLQPRERDYAYVGSFYAFCIFIGFGVLALKEALQRFAPGRLSLITASLVALLAVPVLMASQGWDDHNRSAKTTARDWAKNYLSSCAPNAILFTNADNDTFALWYAQEVEGFRTDVRVICMQFLSDDDYINQLKKQVNNSAPLPVTMPSEKYQKGVRDYIPYVDYGFTDSVELKDLMAVLTSDNKADKIEMADGSFENFLPSRKLKLSVDADQLVKTQTIKAGDREKATSSMEWTIDKKFIGKADLAVYDILANNNWKRPVYFATSSSQDTYMGLDKYLYMEGYAYRLLPLKRDPKDSRDKSQMTNTEVMYQNVMNKMDFSGFNKASYLDEQSRGIARGTWSSNNTLATNLINEGKNKAAHALMIKSVKELPLRNYEIRDTLDKFDTISIFYHLNDLQHANMMAKETVSFLDQELTYIASLSPDIQRGYLRNIQWGMSVLNGLDQETEKSKQTELNKEIKDKFKNFESIFTKSLG